MKVIADISVLPLGTADSSIAGEVNLCQELIEASGLKFSKHAFGTSVEGNWSDVSSTISKCHQALHKKGVERITSVIRVETRKDHEEHIARS